MQINQLLLRRLNPSLFGGVYPLESNLTSEIILFKVVIVNLSLIAVIKVTLFHSKMVKNPGHENCLYSLYSLLWPKKYTMES